MIKGALSKEYKVVINTQKLIKVIDINRQTIKNMIILVDVGKNMIKLNIYSWLKRTSRNLVIEWKFLNQINRICEL